LSFYGFLVEGQMEQLIVQKLCRGAPAVRIGLNGDHVPISSVVARLYPQCELLQKRCKKIIIIFDREKRTESSQKIETEVIDLLAEKKARTDNVHVVVADREFESWISPFIDESGNSHSNIVFNEAEGSCGKARISTAYKLSNRKYTETIDGVALFCSLPPQNIESVSPSFKRLNNALIDHCYWNKRTC
jgi:hypothetical protein